MFLTKELSYVGGIGRGYGGHEHVLQNLHSTFLQLGMVVCGLPPCGEREMQDRLQELIVSVDHMDKAGLAGPLGITMAGAAGSGGRSLDASEVHLARLQGRHTATMARTVRSPMQLIYWSAIVPQMQVGQHIKCIAGTGKDGLR